MRVLLNLRIDTVLAENGLPEDLQHLTKGVANYAMLTMGDCMDSFEGPIGPDGFLKVDWHLKPIKPGTSYYNQIGWQGPPTGEMAEKGLLYNDADSKRIQSHFLLTLYHKYEAPKSVWGTDKRALVRSGAVAPSGGESHPAYAPSHMACFLGATNVDLAAIMQASLDANSSILADAGGTPRTEEQHVLVEHNFVPTLCKCVVASTPLPDLLSEDGQMALAESRRALDDLKAGLADAASRPEGASACGRFSISVFAKQAPTSGIVATQQMLMQAYTMIGVRNKRVELGDTMGAPFSSCSTFLQPKGCAVCFTDLDRIVRNRVVEPPLHMMAINMHSAILMHGFTPARVAAMPPTSRNVKNMLDIYRSYLCMESMDTRQVRYWSDYYVHKMELATEADYKFNRQPCAHPTPFPGKARSPHSPPARPVLNPSRQASW